MNELKIRKIGNAAGVIFPRALLEKMRLKEGDKLFITEDADGGYRITPFDPDFENHMKGIEEGMSRYRNALRQLAK
jgi:putative addiction module antidote